MILYLCFVDDSWILQFKYCCKIFFRSVFGIWIMSDCVRSSIWVWVCVYMFVIVFDNDNIKNVCIPAFEHPVYADGSQGEFLQWFSHESAIRITVQHRIASKYTPNSLENNRLLTLYFGFLSNFLYVLWKRTKRKKKCAEFNLSTQIEKKNERTKTNSKSLYLYSIRIWLTVESWCTYKYKIYIVWISSTLLLCYTLSVHE